MRNQHLLIHGANCIIGPAAPPPGDWRRDQGRWGGEGGEGSRVEGRRSQSSDGRSASLPPLCLLHSTPAVDRGNVPRYGMLCYATIECAITFRKDLLIPIPSGSAVRPLSPLLNLPKHHQTRVSYFRNHIRWSDQISHRCHGLSRPGIHCLSLTPIMTDSLSLMPSLLPSFHPAGPVGSRAQLNGNAGCRTGHCRRGTDHHGDFAPGLPPEVQQWDRRGGISVCRWTSRSHNLSRHISSMFYFPLVVIQ